VWRRYMPDSAFVEFDNLFRHVRTVNSLGWETRFGYAGSTSLLTSITLPVKDTMAVSRIYTFAYDSSSGKPFLSTVTAPGSRVVTLDGVTGNKAHIAAIIDPDGDSTRFHYVANGNLIDTLYNRLTDKTTFVYNTGKKLQTATLDLSRTNGSGASLVHGFVAAETRSVHAGNSTPQPVNKAYTRYDSPRTDISNDTTVFYVDRWGAPDTVVNALGGKTRVENGNSSFPALPTAQTDPTGYTQVSWYNARALVDSSASLDPIAIYRDAFTRYTWSGNWNKVTGVTSPTGDVVSFTYNSGAPTLNKKIVGTDTTKVRYTPTNLVKAVQQPGDTLSDSLRYDAVGNDSLGISPLGYVTTHWRDVEGRDTLVKSPVNTGQTLFIQAATVYDVLGRVAETRSIGPSVTNARSGTVNAQTLKITTTYDKLSHPLTVSRVAIPDSTVVGRQTTTYAYDVAGRLTSETAPDTNAETHAYDGAGNDTLFTNRRGFMIRLAYDALNRLTTRTIPSDTTAKDSVGMGAIRLRYYDVSGKRYPWFPSDAAGDYIVAADTEAYQYDPASRIIYARNGDAIVRRGYYAGGLLRTDTTVVRGIGNRSDSTSHRYGILHRYDLSGRRVADHHPVQLAPAGTSGQRDSVTYTYDSHGRLQTVTDLLGNAFTYSYTRRDEETQLQFPASVRDTLEYDADGRLLRSTLFNTTGIQDYPYPGTKLRRSLLTYDAAGQVLTAFDSLGIKDSLWAEYAGIGHLVYSERRQPAISNFGAAGVLYSIENFALDALGNRWYSTNHDTVATQSPSSTSSATSSTYQSAGRMNLTDYADAQPHSEVRDSLRYDKAGDQHLTYTNYWDESGTHVFSERAMYYGADGRLRASERRTLNDYDPNAFQYQWNWWEEFEEYRYDPLGRRVLVHDRRDCDHGHDPDVSDYCTISLVSRTVWDGNAELYEIRMPDSVYAENDTGHVKNVAVTSGAGAYTDPNPQFGRVAYTYGSSLDRPLSITRINYVDTLWNVAGYALYPSFTVIPLWNWRGSADVGVGSDGGSTYCYNGSSTRCAFPTWRHQSYAFTFNPADTLGGWYGSLINNKEDGTGTLFRRNRYVDPSTGRFTQEDPIGLAGGMNLYGFASGDPVNFADPMGLCPNPIAVGLGALQCWAQDVAAGAREAASNAATQVGRAVDRLELEVASVQGGMSHTEGSVSTSGLKVVAGPATSSVMASAEVNVNLKIHSQADATSVYTFSAEVAEPGGVPVHVNASVSIGPNGPSLSKVGVGTGFTGSLLPGGSLTVTHPQMDNCAGTGNACKSP
jgi:RHS repeat-associated protein